MSIGNGHKEGEEGIAPLFFLAKPDGYNDSRVGRPAFKSLEINLSTHWPKEEGRRDPRRNVGTITGAVSTDGKRVTWIIRLGDKVLTETFDI